MHNNLAKKAGVFLDNKFGTLAMLPALIGLAFVLVYPVTVSIMWSFTNKSIMRQTTDIVWFENFIYLLGNRELWISMRNGLVYTTCTIILQILWGSGAALLLDRFLSPYVTKPFRLLYMIPWTFPVIVSVLVWGWLYNDSGLFSTVLFNQGIIPEPMSFLASKHTALFSVVFVHAWSGAPLIMMSTLAGLQSIPQDQYDVALIEGTNSWQTLRYIIIPNIKRILQVIVVLRCVWIFNNFNMIFLLTGGGPGSATQNLPIMAYKYAWNSMEMGKSSAVSVIMLLFLILMFSVYQWVNSKTKGENNAF
ncbi:sugar ABC transporter permease [uncultured Sphaerochaeta sp.]|uniref:carbohydrate ABC transporter permease n=1 Tax=uncultured Sphaerochaeta sp. TaxID=886478 RepID=UPI0029CA7114|nr:sugar ABC transporter permease [uncultured Sphaerochaeta sp.]